MKLTGKMENERIYVIKVKYNEVDLNASNPGVTVTVDASVRSDEKRLSLAYTSPLQAGKEWADGVLGRNGPPHGTPDLIFKCAALGKWKSSKKADHPNMLTVTLSKKNPWTVRETSQTLPWSAFNASSHWQDYKGLILKLDIGIEMASWTIY
ncbi:hypothetical protein N7522_012739 [Penicillium canescens]|nr:hypothetical protein N7522_012739 [Penicillium canescens]KAJ6158504.1 hypothetical protein N7485_011330 [Penicillium canescens]